jgi:hypothetical protein
LRTASRFLGNVAESRIAQRGENPARYATQFDVLDVFEKMRLPQT